jgi:hypothetical protein
MPTAWWSPATTRAARSPNHHQPDPAGPVARTSRVRCRPTAPCAIAERWRRPRRTTSCCWPARATRPTQEIAGVKHPFSDKAHAHARRCAARCTRGHDPLMTLQQAPAVDSRFGRLWATARSAIARVHTDTRSCSRRPVRRAARRKFRRQRPSWRKPRPAAPWPRIAHHRRCRAGLPCIEVPDTQGRARRPGAGWRAQFDLPLIAVTGSNGKTTVTQMIASHPARLAEPTARWPRRQLQQRDRRAAHAAAPARAPQARPWSSWA